MLPEEDPLCTSPNEESGPLANNAPLTTSRPDHIWPDAWTRIGKAAERREKQDMGNRETEARTCQKIDKNLILLFLETKNTKTSLKMQDES